MPSRDSLFKGATRPPMLFGVPLVPLLVVGGVVLLLSMWISLFLGLALPPLFFLMKYIAKTDDRQFHLLWLRFYFRVFHFNYTRRFWGASVYSPFSFFRRLK
jgi:type IV secretion system protein VirB3